MEEKTTKKHLRSVLAALLLAMEEGLSPTDAANSPFDDVDLSAPSPTLPARDTQLAATNSILADAESTKAKKSKLARARKTTASRARQPSDDEDVTAGATRPPRSRSNAARRSQRRTSRPPS